MKVFIVTLLLTLVSCSTVDDVREGIASIKKSIKKVEATIETMDENKDGAISFNEILNFILVGLGGAGAGAVAAKTKKPNPPSGANA